jgi:hypothetical protein
VSTLTRVGTEATLAGGYGNLSPGRRVGRPLLDLTVALPSAPAPDVTSLAREPRCLLNPVADGTNRCHPPSAIERDLSELARQGNIRRPDGV